MNLFRKVVASATLAALVVSTSATSVSAYTNDELSAANGLAEAGVINDKSANPADYNFSSTIFRNEAAKVALNLDKEVSVKNTCDNSFADVSSTNPNNWTCGYAEALLDAGKISANTNFNPKSSLTKSEATKMMLEAAGCTDIFENSNNWQEETVAFAVDNDIISSFTDYNTPATRAFVFTVAYNAMNSCPIDYSECDDLSRTLGICEENSDNEEDEGENNDKDNKDDNPSNDGVSIELSPESPSDGNFAANTPRTPILAFDITAGNEDLTLDEIRLDYTGLSNYENLDNVKLYIGNTQISKSSKNFNDKYIEISIENDTVIQAGETNTITVTSEIKDSETNSSHQVTLTRVDSSAGSIDMNNIEGATFGVVEANNISSLELDIDVVTGKDIVIGEEIKLADFELEEKNDNESVSVKSFTFQLGGSVDHEDDISNISLYADGEEISSNLTVNSDEEVVVDLDFIIEADEKSTFVLKAIVTGSVSETLSAQLTEIYAVGVETGINSSLTGDAYGNTASSRTIEGSEINVSFDKSDIDESKPDAEEVNVGTLTLSTDGEYNLDRIEVKVKANGSGVQNIISKLELDGKGYDKSSSVALTTATSTVTTPNSTDTTVYYYFEDISLNAETLELPLTFDVINNVALSGTNVDFTVKIVAIEDEENNEKYDLGGTNTAVGTILSTNSLNSSDVDIKIANVTFTSTRVNDRQLVLGNGVETVVYKGKINVGDADSITLKNLNLIDAGSTVLAGSVELDDIVDTATLNIGGKTFDGDIDSDSIDFDTNLDIEAGSDNVEVLVTAILKDNDAVNSNQTLILKVDDTALSSDIEDSDGNDITPIVSSVNSNLATSTLLDRGTFAIKVLKDFDTDDNLENTVLAGVSGVVLAEVELEAEYEDSRVKDLTFVLSGATTDFSTTLDKVKLVSKNGKVLSDGAVVTFESGTGTLISFEDDFIVADSDNLIEAELVADLNNITGAGNETSAISGNITVKALVASNIEVKGDSSNDDLTADISGNVASETVAVVPTKLTFTVLESLSTGTAKIKVTADSGENTVGTNDQVPDVLLENLVHTNLASGTDYSIYKDGNASGQKSSFAALSASDRTFDGDSSVTFVYVPQTTTDGTTYTMVLSGDVATYDVLDSNSTVIGDDLTTTIDSDISVGSISY